MAYLIICKDKKDSLNLRLSNRERHLKYLKSLESKLLMAGPILSKNGDPCGSVIVLNFDEKRSVDKFLRNDPYNIAELFEEVVVHKFKKVF